jgi:hypothetical protein
MPDFKSIKDPAALKPIPFEMADVVVLGYGQQSNIGLEFSGPGQPRQLNCRYVDGFTYVQPVGDGNTALPVKFKGNISPDDCAAWFRANIADAEGSGE